MKITYVTLFDPLDFKKFGGRTAMTLAALREQRADVDVFRPRRSLSFLRAHAIRKVSRSLLRQQINIYRDRSFIRDCSRQIDHHLRASSSDVVFSPMSPGSQPVAYLKTDRPVVIWTDTTLAGWIAQNGLRPRGALERANVRQGLANEAQALRRCDLAVFWSDWAADFAAGHYGIERSRLRVVPSGPSMPLPEHADANQLLARRAGDTCRLLFIGIGWERKGGDIAVATAASLRARGLKVELTLIGSNPSSLAASEGLRPLGFVSKDDPAGLACLRREFERAHFMLLPTRRDCTPLVINEACAHGTPVITSNVGGIRTLVRDGVNGFTLAADTAADQYAHVIEQAFADRQRYAELVRSTLADFPQRLSWPVAARKMIALMGELTRARTAQPLETAALLACPTA